MSLLLLHPSAKQQNGTGSFRLAFWPECAHFERGRTHDSSLRNRRLVAHGSACGWHFVCHDGPKRDPGPKLPAHLGHRHRPSAHTEPPQAPLACTGPSAGRRAHPESAEDGRHLRGLPEAGHFLPSPRGRGGVPTGGAVGEAGPACVPVSPCPPRCQYSRSRLSVQGVPGARPCPEGPEGRGKGKKFHSVLRGAHLWDFRPNQGTNTATSLQRKLLQGSQ